MIIVSGTKRSGTSMWMQVMAAAGFPILGDAFPRNWKNSLKDANPDGFYESVLRLGIYWRTNPHPATGHYFLPEDVDGYAVKVFIPGVIRTERAYITRLFANMREWREYEGSIKRLYSMEDKSRLENNPEAPEPVRFPPAYEWWMENFALVRDISLRKYPARLMSYDRVLRDPEREVRATLEFIGTGDVEKAVAAVKPENRTQKAVESETDIPSDLVEVFDDLYHHIDQEKPVPKTLLDKLNATNKRLLPELTRMQTEVARFQQAMSRTRKTKPMKVTGLPGAKGGQDG